MPLKPNKYRVSHPGVWGHERRTLGSQAEYAGKRSVQLGQIKRGSPRMWGAQSPRNIDNILQGLGVGPGCATERWPSRKIARKLHFFLGEKKLPKIFFFCIYLLVMPKYWGKQIFSHGTFPEVGEKQKAEKNTPGTRGWSRLRDRTLAVAKNRAKMTFFSGAKKNYLKKIFFFCIYLLVMPKYWGKQIFTHRSFPEVGQKQKTEEKKRKTKQKRKLVIKMAKLRMAHASRLGQNNLVKGFCPMLPLTLCFMFVLGKAFQLLVILPRIFHIADHVFTDFPLSYFFLLLLPLIAFHPLRGCKKIMDQPQFLDYFILKLPIFSNCSKMGQNQHFYPP